MLTLFKKNQEEISRTTPGYEETERHTPKTGIILLILMFIAGIYFGLYAMDDLSNIPDRPQALSNCSYQYKEQRAVGDNSPYATPAYYGEETFRSIIYYNSAQCAGRMNPIEQQHGIPALLQKRSLIEQQAAPVIQQYDAVTRSLSTVQQQSGRATDEYGIGLQEKQTGIKAPIFPIPTSQDSIMQLKQSEADLIRQQNDFKTQLDAYRSQADALDKQLVEAYRPVFTAYDHAMRWYDFKVFLLQFLFIIPFFFFGLRKYLELHRKNSPYTVILTTIVAVLGLLLLKTILFWFWGLFLQEVLRVLIEWFGKYGIFRTLLFYSGMLLSFAIFGGAVYLLQKRIFDTRRVAIRRFRAKQCPQCQTNLDLADMFCPNCGAHTRELCPKCGKERFVGMPFCPHCGDRKEM